MLDLIADVDKLLGTNTNYLLGHWIATARAMGTTAADQNLLEFNARNQITLWGPTGQINDYAAKAWNGLVGDYYKGRWSLFIGMLQACMQSKDNCRFPTGYEARLLDYEQAWSSQTNAFPSQPVGM